MAFTETDQSASRRRLSARLGTTKDARKIGRMLFPVHRKATDWPSAASKVRAAGPSTTANLQFIWIAEPTFDVVPTLPEAELVNQWRWPTLFDVGYYLRKGLLSAVGHIPVPELLAEIPLLRGGFPGNWKTVIPKNGIQQIVDVPTQPEFPMFGWPNLPKLKELIESGWKPSDTW